MAFPEQPSGPTAGAATVAVISDDAGMSYVLRRMFELSGLAVVTGHAGQFERDPGRAASFLTDREVRVTVWHVNAADVSGWALAHLLRERTAERGGRVLIAVEDPDALLPQMGAALLAETTPIARDVSALARLAAAVDAALYEIQPSQAGRPVVLPVADA